MLPFNEDIHQMTVERTPSVSLDILRKCLSSHCRGDREENTVAMDLITHITHIRMKLQQPDLRRVSHNLEVIPSTFQARPAVTWCPSTCIDTWLILVSLASNDCNYLPQPLAPHLTSL